MVVGHSDGKRFWPKLQRTNDQGRPSTYSQLIRLFERSSALAADDRRAIAAHQGVVHFTAAGRAVERVVFGLFAVTHPFTFLRAELSSLTGVKPQPLYQHGVIPAVKIDDPLNKPAINHFELI